MSSIFFFTDTAPTEIYTLSLHDALPIYSQGVVPAASVPAPGTGSFRHSTVPRPYPADSSTTRSHPRTCAQTARSEEHTSELQSRRDLVCRLLLEKKKALTEFQQVPSKRR